MNNIETLRSNICSIGKRLYEKGFSPGHSGNISARIEDKILLTPSGLNLGELEPEDIVIIDIDGNISEGNKKPTSEKNMHIGIYKNRPEIKAIIHCHAPKSSAFAVAGIPLDAPILAENVFALGEVPLISYEMPSSDKLANKVAEALKNSEAVLMANHGVSVVGKNLSDAYYKLETLEYYAEVYLWSKVLGNTNLLNNEEIKKIHELKKQMGR